jgi:hypothetical protein
MKIVSRDDFAGTIVVECPHCKTRRPVDALSVQRAKDGVTVVLTCPGPGCGAIHDLPEDLAEGHQL